MDKRLFPLIAMFVVVALAITLQVVIFNGPDTHGLLSLTR